MTRRRASAGRLEGERADYPARLRRRLIVRGVGPVEEMPAMDERRRTAAVEVDGALGAEVDHHLRELGHRQAGIDPRAPAVAGQGDDVLAADAQRRPRMPAL